MIAKLGLGLVGAGRIGQVHARTIARRLPEARLVAVSDPRRDAARAVADEGGAGLVLGSALELVAREEVDAVLVCAPTDCHPEVVAAAAAAGKAVFCEKPLALDLGELDRVLEAVSEAGVWLQVGLNRRFDPDFRRVRELVAEGAVGTLELLRVTSRDPEPPPAEYVAASGGLFLDMMIHDLDMVRFLSGLEVEEVYAAAAVLVDPAIGEAGDVDTAVVTLRLEGGAIATIDNSRRAVYGYDQRVEVFGSAGMVSNRNRSATVVSLAGPTGSLEAPPLHFFMDRYTDSYEAELRSFVRAVLEGREPEVTGRDARAATVLAYAAMRSHAERRPVRPAEI